MICTGFRKFLPIVRSQPGISRLGLRMGCMAGLFLMLAGCSSETLNVGLYDGTTGKTTTIAYSKHYDNGVWLLKDRLGLVVRVEQEKKKIPFTHATAQAFKSFAPEDTLTIGNVSITLWNFDSVPHQVRFKRMVVRSGEMDFQNHVITAPAHEQSEIAAGHVPIFNYGKSIPMTLEVEVAGKPLRIELELPRRTKQQWNQFSSPGAVLPYPWGARSVKG